MKWDQNEEDNQYGIGTRMTQQGLGTRCDAMRAWWFMAK